MKGNRYKIIVADKETKYVSMISRLAQTNTIMVKVMKHVISGQELVLQTEQLEPDILFVDIKLNDLNGIDAIKQIREFNKAVHIILLTELDSFEFMKEAIPLGLEAYVLKPIKKEDILREMNKILVLLEVETERKMIEKERAVSMQECGQLLEHGCIYSILYNKEYMEDTAKYQKVLNCGMNGYIMNTEIKSRNKYKKIELEKYSDELCKCMKQTISKHNICIVGPRIKNRIISFISEENKGTKEQKRVILDLCEEVIENVRNTLGIELEIGVGSIQPVEQIGISYEEALNVLRYKNEKSARVFDDSPEWKEVHKTYIEMERILLSNLKLGQEQLFENFFNLLTIMKDLELEVKINKVIELLVLCCREGRADGVNENFYTDYITYLEELKSIKEEEIETWALAKLHDILKSIRTQKTNQLPLAISTAVTYINKHYTDNIQLDDVAQKVNFTPQYFSTYFKEEMECTFLDYITELRMKKAQELICNSDKRVQEIGYMVGYHNPNYFSRIFKKYNDCTPSEYKRNKKKEKEKQNEMFMNID